VSIWLDLIRFSIYIQIMSVKTNVQEAKVHLSRYLELVAQGETVIVCRRNVPVAELRAIAQPRRRPRPIGLARGSLVVAPEFFEPLPAELLAAFRGENA